MKKNKKPSSNQETPQSTDAYATSLSADCVIPSDNLDSLLPPSVATPLNERISTSIAIAEDGYNSQDSDVIEIEHVMAIKYPVVANDVFGQELQDGSGYQSDYKRKQNALDTLNKMKKREEDSAMFCQRLDDEANTVICSTSEERLQALVRKAKKQKPIYNVEYFKQ
jgi:hypothetical protein